MTEDYPAINGLICTESFDYYFTSGNFSFLKPSGTVFRGSIETFGAEPVASGPWMANGMADSGSRIYFSDTLSGILCLQEGLKLEKPEWFYRKVRATEAVDDFAIDSRGMLWMSDPGGATVKRFDPNTKTLTLFYINGIGQTSACALSNDNGTEVLYITELKQSQKRMSGDFDGRGILVIPVESLEKLDITKN